MPPRIALRLLVPCFVLFSCSTDDGANNEGNDPGNVPVKGTGGSLDPGASGGVEPGATGGLAQATGGFSSSGGAGASSGGETSGSGGGSGANPLVIEEQQAGHCSVDGMIESTNAGFTGSGYLNSDNEVGASITWSLEVRQAGTYSLTFFHSNAAEARPAQLLINGVVQEANLPFAATSDWSTWAGSPIEITLPAGPHTVSLAATSAQGLANIDRLEVSGAEAEPGECEMVEEPDGTDPITIWLAGDSTVANGSTPCPSGWGKFFANAFNDKVTVANRAVGGRSVRTWLYDVNAAAGGDGECTLKLDGTGSPIIQARWVEMLEQMSAGDYLLIQFGINDGDRSCPRHVGGQAFKREYAMMAQAAYDRGAQPVFLTPVSAIRCSGSTAVGSRGFLTETFDVGASEEVPVIDLHQLSVDLYQELNFCPVPGGGVSAGTGGPVGDFFCDDHTHFSDAGGEQIASLIARAIGSGDLGLKSYLK